MMADKVCSSILTNVTKRTFIFSFIKYDNRNLFDSRVFLLCIMMLANSLGTLSKQVSRVLICEPLPLTQHSYRQPKKKKQGLQISSKKTRQQQGSIVTDGSAQGYLKSILEGISRIEACSEKMKNDISLVDAKFRANSQARFMRSRASWRLIPLIWTLNPI